MFNIYLAPIFNIIIGAPAIMSLNHEIYSRIFFAIVAGITPQILITHPSNH
jgi:hypothetical protein